MNHHVAAACRKVGSITALAHQVGVSIAVVSQWVSGYRSVPATRCIPIEKATSGAVRCEDLRPDVDWAYLRGTAPTQTPTEKA